MDGSVVWLHILLGPYWCVCVCVRVVCGVPSRMSVILNSAPHMHQIQA